MVKLGKEYVKECLFKKDLKTDKGPTILVA